MKTAVYITDTSIVAILSDIKIKEAQSSATHDLMSVTNGGESDFEENLHQISSTWSQQIVLPNPTGPANLQLHEIGSNKSISCPV